MESVDLRKLDIAIEYVQRMSEGYNPVNNIPADDDSVLNNPNVIRCMFFVKEVLKEVKRNNGLIGSKREKAKKEPFPFEILKEFHYEEDKSISHLLRQIQSPAGEKNIKKISIQTITTWLKNADYLTEEYCQEAGKISTVPTEKGKALGIYTELRSYSNNTYLIVIYNRNAQEFLVKNLEAIVNGEVVE